LLIEISNKDFIISLIGIFSLKFSILYFPFKVEKRHKILLDNVPFYKNIFYFVHVLERKKLTEKLFKRNGSFFPIIPNNVICIAQKIKQIQILLTAKNKIKYSAKVKNKKPNGSPNICLFSDTDLYICAFPSIIDGSLNPAIFSSYISIYIFYH
jgi:hypothetical protein